MHVWQYQKGIKKKQNCNEKAITYPMCLYVSLWMIFQQYIDESDEWWYLTNQSLLPLSSLNVALRDTLYVRGPIDHLSNTLLSSSTFSITWHFIHHPCFTRAIHYISSSFSSPLSIFSVTLKVHTKNWHALVAASKHTEKKKTN